MSPDRFEETIELAWEALETGAFDDAARLAREAQGLDSEAGEAVEVLARALGGSGDLAAAEALLEAQAKKSADEAWPLWAHADLLLREEEPDPDRALDLLQRAAKRASGDGPSEAEIAWLQGVAHLTLGDEGLALKSFERALEKDPDHGAARLDRGLLRFELGQMDAARADLEPLATGPDDSPDAWHTLGLIAERKGDAAAAKQAFARATGLDPEAFPPPTTLTEAEFDAAVKEALADLPGFAKEQLGNVTVTVAPLPSDEDLDGGALSPTMLGIFRGTPLGSRSVASAADHATAQIFLFQKNLERFATDREALIEQIGITVAHEVGHLLGLDEDDLKARGLD